MNFVRLFLTGLTVMSTGLFGQDESILLETAKKGFEARAIAGGILNKEASVPAFRKPFKGQTDSQKIEAIVLYLYDIDQSDSKLSMSASSIYDAVCALSDDNDFIKDWSSLRQTLQDERDARKFYLLSSLVSMSKNGAKYDFIAERTHMLFAEGRVTKREGEYTREYAHDVSLYAYRSIVSNLRVLGANFEEPPKDLPHEDQAVILAKWLKVNWPGCENIKIPGQMTPGDKRPDKKTQGAEISLLPTANALKEKASPTAKADQAAKKSHWPWFIGGVILLVLIFSLIRVVKIR